MRRKFLVELEVPEGAKVTDCATYIREAVATWAGSLRPPCSYDDNDPGDPMFNLDRTSIIVKRHYK